MIHLLGFSYYGLVFDIGRSLREGFFMFWETLWPLVLGFGLSGAVQAFVSHADMQRKLGDHGPRSVLRASGFGMVSSSCSYAASAMSKTLFVRGADFVSSLVFMFASTNLVIELGIVLIVLIGWQFALSEFVGGAIMIVLLATAGGIFLRGSQVVTARERLSNTGSSLHEHKTAEDSLLQRQPWGVRLRSVGGWADAASYTMADLIMLRKEMVIGYVVAGFLATLVPAHLWNIIFIPGHGIWTSVENVIVGPFIAIISFVCSIGNVPLAAALWKGGISFGGVVSFIFADLIAMPLLLIYRKYYGGRLALRMLAVFWAVMAIAGLITELIFRSAGLVPTTRTTQIVAAHFSWNYTTYLNFIFLALFAALYWLYRNRNRLGGGLGYALDPVCGMQVETANAPASTRYNDTRIYFCSDRCAERFYADSERFTAKGASPGGMEVTATGTTVQLSETAAQFGQGHNEEHHHKENTMTSTIDPVCGMTVESETAAANRDYQGQAYFFCSLGCADRFDADPERYHRS